MSPENPSRTPSLPSPSGQLAEGPRSGSGASAYSRTLCVQDGATNSFAWENQSIPFRNAASSAPRGSCCSRANTGRTFGVQRGKGKLRPDSQANIHRQTSSQASAGAYRPVINPLSFVVET